MTTFVAPFIAQLLLLQLPHAQCLRYEPHQVRLDGTLLRQTFPGPPNYTDTTSGDTPERVFLIHLSHPICVGADSTDPVNQAERNVVLVQLIPRSEPVMIIPGNVVGKRVRVTGYLFHGSSGHHHTQVLINASILELR
jgi:hypothetical protein